MSKVLSSEELKMHEKYKECISNRCQADVEAAISDTEERLAKLKGLLPPPDKTWTKEDFEAVKHAVRIAAFPLNDYLDEVGALEYLMNDLEDLSEE